MDSLKEKTIKAIVKARILEEAKKWSFHMVKKPNFSYKEKTMVFDSNSHLKLLRNTLEHLLALKSAYSNGSATKHIISQTCSRLKRLITRLEKTA